MGARPLKIIVEKGYDEFSIVAWQKNRQMAKKGVLRQFFFNYTNAKNS